MARASRWAPAARSRSPCLPAVAGFWHPRGMRALMICLSLLVACGGDDDGQPVLDAGDGADAALGTADAAEGLTAAYRRVIPGYDTEEACRAENPDKLFACVELVSLCPEEVAYILFTDIVFDGVWVEDGDTATVTFETWDAAFSEDCLL